MADRYWMKMTIGGNVSVDVHKELMEIVDYMGFENVEQEDNGNLEMNDCELTWSTFTDIKEFCEKHLLPYTIQVEAKYGEDGFLEWWQPGMEESRAVYCNAYGEQVFTVTQLVDANAEIETIKRFLQDNAIPELPPFCVQGQEESEVVSP